MSAWKTVSIFLVFIGILWMTSPLLTWAVMSDFGSALDVGIRVTLGAAFIAAGIIILRIKGD